MSPQPSHCTFFDESTENLATRDGDPVRIIEISHNQNQAILQEWALHLRRHYSSDADLAIEAHDMGISASDYLRDIKFPNRSGLGPGTRAGDFCEILVADYLEYIMNCVVPRTRYDTKPTPNESTRGTDVIAFKLDSSGISSRDQLISCEVKGALASAHNGFQSAVNDSRKDIATRIPYAVNAMRQKLRIRGMAEELAIAVRFSDKVTRPYTEITGAAFVCSTAYWEDEYITGSFTGGTNSNAIYFAFRGFRLMDLVHQLYEIAYASA